MSPTPATGGITPQPRPPGLALAVTPPASSCATRSGSFRRCGARGRARDVACRDAAEVAAELGLVAGQEQRILNQAWAALRDSLSRLARRDPR